jgi:NADPH-dependent curcumin reductase CurA
MMASKNMQVLLASRPVDWVKESDFRLVESEMPQPGSGEVLVKNLYLSLDPYMRGRMDDAKSYAANVPIGGVMVGGTVGEVIESRSPALKAGDTVVGSLGWQQYGIAKPESLKKVDPKLVPLSAYLGAVGMPGVTAWYGLLEIGQPKPGETVLVSAASGAVGSVVGQIAKMKGCGAIGIAGGPAKCRYVMSELGFDTCVDYKAGNLPDALRAAAPKGVDVYFDNVGGEILDTALRSMNPFSRIALCGMISQYNATEPYGVKNLRFILINRSRFQGFIISDHLDRWPEALSQLAQWVAQGKLKYHETIAQGLENAPKAFIGMLRGENLGKQLVKLS